MQSRSGQAKRVAQIERSLQSAKSADRLLLSEEDARAVSNGLCSCRHSWCCGDHKQALGCSKASAGTHKALLMHRGYSVGTTSAKYCVLADLIPVCHHLLEDSDVQTRG